MGMTKIGVYDFVISVGHEGLGTPDDSLAECGSQTSLGRRLGMGGDRLLPTPVNRPAATTDRTMKIHSGPSILKPASVTLYVTAVMI